MGAPTLGESERVRRIQNKNAPKYDRQMNFFDPVLFAGGREWACAQAHGDVLEIAVGSGRNLPYYPQGVKLTAIEFSPEMLAIARERAAQLGREVDLREAEALDFADDSFTEGGERKLMIAWLRYGDTFVKRDGAWLFAERKLYVDWTETRSSRP